VETLLLISVLILLLVIVALRIEIVKWRKRVDQVLKSHISEREYFPEGK
jgi:hypothetical protein